MKKLFTLGFAIILSVSAFAQIPNASFETWDSTAGYGVPVGWESADSLTGLGGVYTCEQGNPGFSGSHYLKLTSKNVLAAGVAAGIALSGKLDFTTFLPKSGYAFTGRPANLTGEWQYAPATGDTGVIALSFTKWTGTTRDTVGYIYYKLPGSVTSWTAFSIPINYLSTENPDTAEIYLSSSGALTAAAGSYLYIDTLAFSGTVTGTTLLNDLHSSLCVYPNPSEGSFTTNITSAINEVVDIMVTDIIGTKVLVTTTATNTPTQLKLDAPTGVYFLNAQTTHGHWCEQLTIVR